MLYTILCYNCEETTGSWTKEQDDAVSGGHRMTGEINTVLSQDVMMRHTQPRQ